MSFPDNMIRGINSKNLIQEDGLVSTDVFYFTDDHTRDDGTFEQSINWEDEENVILFSLKQKKDDGNLQFGGGVAILNRHEIDRLSKLPTISEALSYDRAPIENNPYHGNLLLSAGVTRPRRKLIAATLAIHVMRVVHQQE